MFPIPRVSTWAAHRRTMCLATYPHRSATPEHSGRKDWTDERTQEARGALGRHRERVLALHEDRVRAQLVRLAPYLLAGPRHRADRRRLDRQHVARDPPRGLTRRPEPAGNAPHEGDSRAASGLTFARRVPRSQHGGPEPREARCRAPRPPLRSSRSPRVDRDALRSRRRSALRSGSSRGRRCHTAP